MNNLTLLVELLPFAGAFIAGLYFIAEVFIPSLRPRDFNRWEVDEGGSEVDVNVAFWQWRKVLTPPRVVAQGYMSNRAACTVAVVAGLVCICIAVLGVRHLTGFPNFIPDPVGQWTFR